MRGRNGVGCTVQESREQNSLHYSITMEGLQGLQEGYRSQSGVETFPIILQVRRFTFPSYGRSVDCSYIKTVLFIGSHVFNYIYESNKEMFKDRDNFIVVDAAAQYDVVMVAVTLSQSYSIAISGSKA